MTRFDRKSIEAAQGDWSRASDVNSTLDLINLELTDQLELTDAIRKSKLAWKISWLRSAHLYRCLDLGEATISLWNSGLLLPSVIMARSLLESEAVVSSLKSQLINAVKNEDIDEIALVSTNGMFATKDAQLLTHGLPIATNILTQIEKFDRRIPNVRDFYETYSEIAHPNYMGHLNFYSKREGVDVHFSRSKRSKCEVLKILSAPLSTLAITNNDLTEIQSLVFKVSDLQHKIDPVPGRGDKTQSPN